MTDAPPPQALPADPTQLPAGDAVPSAIGTLDSLFRPDAHGRMPIGTGPAAELRRMQPTQGVLPPAFWHVLFLLPEAVRSGRTEAERERAERSWALIVHGMATLAPKPHETPAWVGQVLSDADKSEKLRHPYPEQRFVRLLRAEGPDFAHEVGLVCRWLRSRGRPVDWIDFARFILARRSDDAERAERQIHRMARNYFATAAPPAQSEDTMAHA